MVSLGDDRLRLHQLCSDAQQCVDIRQQWQCGWSTMAAMCMGGRQRRQCGWSIVWAVWVVDSGCSVGGPLQWPFWWSVLVAVWWSTVVAIFVRGRLWSMCRWQIVVAIGQWSIRPTQPLLHLLIHSLINSSIQSSCRLIQRRVIPANKFELCPWLEAYRSNHLVTTGFLSNSGGPMTISNGATF